MGRIRINVKDNIKKIMNKETMLYLFFGVLTTVVNFGTFVGMNYLIGEKYYLISNIFSFISATLFAFVTNKQFVFESKEWRIGLVVKELVSFFSARISTFILLEEIGLWFAVRILKVSTMKLYFIDGTFLAKIILAFLAVLFNYVLSKWFIFKTKEKVNESNFNNSSIQ